MQIEQLNTIGILGGMSAAATAEYYRLINQKVNAYKGGRTIAELIINSVNFANIERFVRSDEWELAGTYLAKKAQQTEAAGATCLFIGSNTMHRVRAAIQAAIHIPFVDIFATVALAMRKAGYTKAGILGTYPVMTDAFYFEAYGDHGIQLISPDEPAKKEIDRIIFDEMTNHQFLPQSKAYYLQTIDRLVAQGAEAIILGCTEIKLLINQSDRPRIPFFDTTDLHCEMAAKICTGMVDPTTL